MEKMKSFTMRKISAHLHESLRQFASFIDYSLWYIFDYSRFKSEKKQKIEKILIILINQEKGNVGGDFVTLGVMNYFKELFLEKEIYFLSDKNTIKQFGNATKINFIEFKGKESINELKEKNFDAVLFMNSGSLNVQDLKFIPQRVGFTRLSVSNLFKLKNKLGYSNKIYNKISGHMVDLRFKMLEALGFKFNKKKLVFFNSKKDEKIVNNFLNKNKVNKFIVIHPGGKYVAESYKKGKWPPHLWNLERYSEVADNFSNKEYKILITGSKEESILAKEIIKNSKNKKEIFDICGKLSITQSGALLKKSKLLIATDTAIVHLGYQVGVPIVELMGPSIPETVGAWPTNSPLHKILVDKGPYSRSMRKLPFKDNYNCLKNIKTKEVIKAAEKLI